MLQHSNVGIGRYPQNQNPRIFEHKSQHSVYNWASERQWLLSLHRYMTRPLVTVTQNIDEATCCSCWHMITVSSWMNGRGGRLSWRGGGPGGWPRTGGRRRRRRRRRWRRSAILNQRQQLNTETGLNIVTRVLCPSKGYSRWDGTRFICSSDDFWIPLAANAVVIKSSFL